MPILYVIVSFSSWAVLTVDANDKSNVIYGDEADVVVRQSSLSILVWSMEELE